MVSQIIEGTIVLIALFLVLMNAANFGTVAQNVGNVYTGAVRTLQGR